MELGVCVMITGSSRASSMAERELPALPAGSLVQDHYLPPVCTERTVSFKKDTSRYLLAEIVFAGLSC